MADGSRLEQRGRFFDNDELSSLFGEGADLGWGGRVGRSSFLPPQVLPPIQVINVKNCSLSTTYNGEMTHRKQQK